jgi:hypothetical protein
VFPAVCSPHKNKDIRYTAVKRSTALVKILITIKLWKVIRDTKTRRMHTKVNKYPVKKAEEVSLFIRID